MVAEAVAVGSIESPAASKVQCLIDIEIFFQTKRMFSARCRCLRLPCMVKWYFGYGTDVPAIERDSLLWCFPMQSQLLPFPEGLEEPIRIERMREAVSWCVIGISFFARAFY
jgi:hypothetical protein